MRFQSRIIDGLLEPLSQFYDDPDMVEVRVNEPHKVVIDRRGASQTELFDVPDLTIARIEKICRALANRYQLVFDPISHPTLSCALSEGHRFQCTVGTSIRNGVGLAIRCKHPYVPSWEEMGIDPWLQDFLKEIMLDRLNILISGATNTGKTTFINRLLKFLPDDERVISAEDTFELDVERFWDGVSFLAAREERTARGQLNYGQIYDATNRLTPTRVIFGELSRENTQGALDFLNAGNGGFMLTLHSDSPEQAIERKFDQMLSSVGKTMANVPDYLKDTIDVVIQIKRFKDPDTGQDLRRISDLLVLGKASIGRPEQWIIQDFEKVGHPDLSQGTVEVRYA